MERGKMMSVFESAPNFPTEIIHILCTHRHLAFELSKCFRFSIELWKIVCRVDYILVQRHNTHQPGKNSGDRVGNGGDRVGNGVKGWKNDKSRYIHIIHIHKYRRHWIEPRVVNVIFREFLSMNCCCLCFVDSKLYLFKQSFVRDFHMQDRRIYTHTHTTHRSKEPK